MPETPSYDDFLADPAGCWLADPASIPHDWAVQAARASLEFRETLQGRLEDVVGRSGGLGDAADACAILVEVFDAQDIALLFGRLTRVRPPADWAADFARRFARS